MKKYRAVMPAKIVRLRDFKEFYIGDSCQIPLSSMPKMLQRDIEFDTFEELIAPFYLYLDTLKDLKLQTMNHSLPTMNECHINPECVTITFGWIDELAGGWLQQRWNIRDIYDSQGNRIENLRTIFK